MPKLLLCSIVMQNIQPRVVFTLGSTREIAEKTIFIYLMMQKFSQSNLSSLSYLQVAVLSANFLIGGKHSDFHKL